MPLFVLAFALEGTLEAIALVGLNVRKFNSSRRFCMIILHALLIPVTVLCPQMITRCRKSSFPRSKARPKLLSG